MTSTPNGVRPSRSRRTADGEAAATTRRMAETIVDAILKRGNCHEIDLTQAMFSADEIRLHREDAMRIARADKRVQQMAAAA